MLKFFLTDSNLVITKANFISKDFINRTTTILVNCHNNFGNKNFLSNISLSYPSGFFANIKVSWYSPIKSRRILLAGNKKIIEFDDNESDSFWLIQ